LHVSEDRGRGTLPVRAARAIRRARGACTPPWPWTSFDPDSLPCLLPPPEISGPGSAAQSTAELTLTGAARPTHRGRTAIGRERLRIRTGPANGRVVAAPGGRALSGTRPAPADAISRRRCVELLGYRPRCTHFGRASHSRADCHRLFATTRCARSIGPQQHLPS
jgi:hypothetical protein